MDEKFYWLGFAMCSGIGPSKFKLLITYFNSAENAWNANEMELKTCVGRSATELIIQHRKNFSPEAYYEKLQRANVDFITLTDSFYPKLLTKIEKPPYVLFIKGKKELLKEVQSFNCLGVVGTRKITDYGRQVTETLTGALASAGYVIVSGLALGVDAVAHKSAIESGGKTIAVLGCGIDCCNPRENTRLYHEIIEHDGLIVSEYGLGIQPNKGSFPARNRIIAGLSVGIVVTEGAEDSGSLITAEDAFKNNRKVFAVPGPITSAVSHGPLALINKGATLVTSVHDILNNVGLHKAYSRRKKKLKGDTNEEQKIINLLSRQDLHFDELVKRTGFDSSQIGTILSLMEMKGSIKSLKSGFFSLNT